MQTIWLFVPRPSSSHELNSQIALSVSHKSTFLPSERSIQWRNASPQLYTRSAFIKYVSVSVISIGVQRISEMSFDSAHTPTVFGTDNIHAIIFLLPFGVQIAFAHRWRWRRRRRRLPFSTGRGASRERTSSFVHFWKRNGRYRN